IHPIPSGPLVRVARVRTEGPSGGGQPPSPGAPRAAAPAYPAPSGAMAEALLVPDPSGPPSPGYPARMEIAYPAELNRWLPLIKWLLVIPHFIALFFVGIGAFFVAIYGFFAVLITGHWPRGAFDYLVGTVRWAYRVIAYFHLMTDAYPPFSMGTIPDTRCACTSTSPSTWTTGARSCSGCWQFRICGSPASSTG